MHKLLFIHETRLETCFLVINENRENLQFFQMFGWRKIDMEIYNETERRRREVAVKPFIVEDKITNTVQNPCPVYSVYFPCHM